MAVVQQQKKVISANLEEQQISDLSDIASFTGIENQQVHIRLAIRQYIEREKAKMLGRKI